MRSTKIMLYYVIFSMHFRAKKKVEIDSACAMAHFCSEWKSAFNNTSTENLEENQVFWNHVSVSLINSVVSPD